MEKNWYDPNSRGGKRAIAGGRSDEYGRPLNLPDYIPKANLPGSRSKSGYAEIPDYMNLAKEYLPAPAALKPIESMPEYGKALSWDLPAAPKLAMARSVDPAAYENKWKLSSDAIRKSFYDSGGANDQAVNSVLERGLGTSGDKGRVMGDVAESFANALANARMGLDTERMREESDISNQNAALENSLNQYLYGSEFSRNQALSSNAANLLGMRTDRDVYESERPLAYAKDVLGAATGLTSQQNELLAKQWEQKFQEAQVELNKEMSAQQAKSAAEQAKFENLMTMLGEVNFGKDQERKMIEWLSEQPGSPLQGYLDEMENGEDLGASNTWLEDYVRKGYGESSSGGETDITGMPKRPLPGKGFGDVSGAPPFPGAYVGESIRATNGKYYFWDGVGWNKS